jgi:hypothetical protein
MRKSSKRPAFEMRVKYPHSLKYFSLATRYEMCNQGAAHTQWKTTMMTFRLGDRVDLADDFGRIVDIDPDDRNELLVAVTRQVRVGHDYIAVVERGSLLRRWAMRVTSFALLVRDLGLRGALSALSYNAMARHRSWGLEDFGNATNICRAKAWPGGARRGPARPGKAWHGKVGKSLGDG